MFDRWSYWNVLDKDIHKTYNFVLSGKGFGLTISLNLFIIQEVRSSVRASLLFDVQHPFQLDEQITLSGLIDFLSDQVKTLLTNK